MKWTKVEPKDQELSDTWRPKAGDELIGEYIKKETEVGKYKSNLYSIKTDKTITKVWGCTALDAKFDDVSIGDEIKIEFLGEREGKNGNIYKAFELWINM